MNFNPAKTPSLVNNCVWNSEQAINTVNSNAAEIISHLKSLAAIESSSDTPADIIIYKDSVTQNGNGIAAVAELADKQVVILSLNPAEDFSLTSIKTISSGNDKLNISAADTDNIHAYLKKYMPHNLPQAVGITPRLGIGNRHSTIVWPGIFDGVKKVGGPHEIIQNSAFRELAPMEYILSKPTGEATYLPGHGSLSVGHTGSSIEGLWLYGVLSILKYGFNPLGKTPQIFCADLDHIPVKSADEEGLNKAKKLIECGRHFSFFTLDTSFLFKLEETDPDKRYGAAIDAAVELFNTIKSLKGSEPFDFEFSLDEAPHITTVEETECVLKRLTEKGVSTQFVAPNFGFEKRVDYRLPDGLPALEERVRLHSEAAGKYGASIDFHSGSDKSSETYRTVSRACRGKIKLKVSGKLQLILSETMQDTQPEFFNEWWDWTLGSAKAEAERGSDVAVKYLKILEDRKIAEGVNFTRSAKDLFFTDFSFGMVGAKDEEGNFLYRERFYDLPESVLREYARRTSDYIVKLAEDLNIKG